MKYQTFRIFTAAIAAGLLFTMGCSGQQPAAPPAHGAGHNNEHAHSHGGHDHPDHGPHHGQLIELGNEEYHAELVHDDASHTVTIYLLDSHAKDSVAVELTEVMLNLVVGGKPQQFPLAAQPQPADPEGQSSCFVSSDEALTAALDSDGATGRLNVEIDGKVYVGAVEHHDHDHQH